MDRSDILLPTRRRGKVQGFNPTKGQRRWNIGSADEGAIIAVSVHKPTSLLLNLNQIPLVESVSKKSSKIAITLTNNTS